MELAAARTIAEDLKAQLLSACDRIEIAGSIRRRKPVVGDIELLVIPKFVNGVDQLDREIKQLMSQSILGYRPNKLGNRSYGPEHKLLTHLPSGIGVDIFSTDTTRWWIALVVRTGGKATNISIATAARGRGCRFHAYGAGFSTPRGQVVCRSEREVFEAVGLPYRRPEERS